MDSSFKYEPLNPEKNEIRLISIAPGLLSDDLKGRLFHVTLDQAPKYDALSYCWADAKGTVQPNPPSDALNVEPLGMLRDTVAQSELPPRGHILVDGQRFQPTANLEAALRRLRSQKDELVIWIDAICIDQSNTKERNEQVAKMRLIYHGAEVVRIWLGESYDQSGKMFSFIRKLSMLWESGTKSEVPVAKELCNPKNLESMVSLFDRPYWYRVWVVQEVTVARSAAVHCGPDTVIWSEFLNSLRAIFFKKTPQVQMVDKSVNVQGLVALASCGVISFTPEEQPAIQRYRLRSSLEKLLVVHRAKKSTNPKDKVFALIGISEAQDDLSFVIDYSRSLRNVFTDVIEYLLTSKSSLNLICFTTITTTIPDLPSWVPDLTSATTWISGREQNLIETTETLQGRKADASISTDKTTLTAHGFCIDRIDHVGRLHNFYDNCIEVLRTFHAWRKLVIDVKGNGEEDQARFLRSTLCNSNPDLDINSYFRDLTSLSHRLLPGQLIDERLKECMVQSQDQFAPEYSKTLESLAAAYLEATILNRRLFITQEGRIGTAANKVEIRDKVCVIFGCAYLVVLRAKDDGYVVIGDAYIDGLGVVEAERELEEEKYEVEKFKIR